MGTAMTLGFRTRTRAMNRLLVGSCLFSTAAFVLTYILAEDTEQYFAWTVQPPLSAAFFGAGYGAGALLAGLSLRERSWARIRPGVLAIIVFATLTLVVTLLHRDRFHFGAGGFAEGSAWLWLAIYVVFPIAGVIALVTEWRALGSDPPPAGPIPPALRGILAIQAVVLGLLGLGLLLFPESVASFWPWMLTPLTARAIGAWLLPIGLAGIWVVFENDLGRSRLLSTTYIFYAILVIGALARFREEIDWSHPSAWALAAMVALILVTGIAGRVAAARLPAGS
jgi:hypothetical protein